MGAVAGEAHHLVAIDRAGEGRGRGGARSGEGGEQHVVAAVLGERSQREERALVQVVAGERAAEVTRGHVRAVVRQDAGHRLVDRVDVVAGGVHRAVAGGAPLAPGVVAVGRRHAVGDAGLGHRLAAVVGARSHGGRIAVEGHRADGGAVAPQEPVDAHGLAGGNGVRGGVALAVVVGAGADDGARIRADDAAADDGAAGGAAELPVLIVAAVAVQTGRGEVAAGRDPGAFGREAEVGGDDAVAAVRAGIDGGVAADDEGVGLLQPAEVAARGPVVRGEPRSEVDVRRGDVVTALAPLPVTLEAGGALVGADEQLAQVDVVRAVHRVAAAALGDAAGVEGIGLAEAHRHHCGDGQAKERLDCLVHCV